MDAVNKNRKNSEACSRSTYIVHLPPIYTSVNAAKGCEANVILKRIGKRLSFKWNKSYSEVMDWT